MTDQDVEISEDRKSFRVINPQWPMSKGRCVLRLQPYESFSGDTSRPWIALVHKKDTVAYAFAIAHEIGHLLQLAPESLAPSQQGANNPDHYRYGGDHCKSGAAVAPGAFDAAALVEKSKPGARRHGDCIMWSPVSLDFQYVEPISFCPTCRRFLRARNLNTLEENDVH